MESYATYEQYTLVHSDKGVSQIEINSGWLPYGTLRVNEALGGFYTIPFSSNNLTARSLCVDYAHLGLLIRSRKKDDSKELIEAIKLRVASITSSGSPMVTEDSELIYPDRDNVFSVYSSTAEHKPVFDMRDAIDQRIDPDLIDDLNFEDM